MFIMHYLSSILVIQVNNRIRKRENWPDLDTIFFFCLKSIKKMTIISLILSKLVSDNISSNHRVFALPDF